MQTARTTRSTARASSPCSGANASTSNSRRASSNLPTLHVRERERERVANKCFLLLLLLWLSLNVSGLVVLVQSLHVQLEGSNQRDAHHGHSGRPGRQRRGRGASARPSVAELQLALRRARQRQDLLLQLHGRESANIQKYVTSNNKISSLSYHTLALKIRSLCQRQTCTF